MKRSTPPTQFPSLPDLKSTYAHIKSGALKDFFKFLTFQSISADPDSVPQLQACVSWLSDYLKSSGLDVEVWKTEKHPVIFASHLKAGPNAPTVLIYNHYDVQPVDPIDLWSSPPFEPQVRNNEVFARGAQDNKGQCFYTIQAIKALLAAFGELPVNLKLIIEGEEETGSHSLSKILSSKKKALKADYLVIVDVGIPDEKTPAVTLGARGIVTMDVSLQGSNTDMHSGSHGGIAYNPLHALVELLSKLRDPATGQITVPGFYDDVTPLTKSEHDQLSFHFDEEKYKKEFAAIPTGGEKGYSPKERSWTRPTIEINGINGGYNGPGFKTVIPAKATAKLSCRLVPHQDPQKIGHLVADFLKKNASKGVQVEVKVHEGGGPAVRASPDSPIVKAFAEAYQEIFQAPTRYTLTGGSIPIVSELAKACEGEVVLVGLGLSGDQIHAPNEHFGLDRFEQGFLLISRALTLLGTNGNHQADA